MFQPWWLMLLTPSLLAAVNVLVPLDPFGEPRIRTHLSEARRFVVWLQDLKEGALPALDPDVLVVDYSWDGGPEKELSSADVRRLRTRAKGRRIVLAYMSIGEAEDYRFYWPKARDAKIVGPKNSRWPGNYLVRYWDPAWHSIIYSDEDSYLARILRADFDGVFLDTIDAAEVWEERGFREARASMAQLVLAIAREARRKKPGFVVIGQNPLVILEERGILENLSAICLESQLYPGGKPVPKARMKEVLAIIQRLRGLGLPVFVLEYPRGEKARKVFAQFCAAYDIPCYAGPTLLDGPGWVLEGSERP